MCHGQELQVEHLPASISVHDTNGFHNNFNRKSEKEVILETLKRNNGNRKHAADELGMHRSTLWRKLKTHGID
jgi:transcriptional regulator of acetoin/glycerol metabolism